ncbi:MAG: pilus assembly protein [Marinosulfonomonas sp.]|nr:pilus assembly protein [Marinosulfonomonas sp.]
MKHNPAKQGRNANRGRRSFMREERGAALVEFAIILPMMLLIFAVIIEGSRMMISFQAAISGVRDATRYLSRVAPVDICSTSGGSVASYSAQLHTIVSQGISGNSVFPTAVTVNFVTPSFNCVAGTYRVNPAGVAQVTANVTITFPFAGLFTLNGQNLPQITTNVTDAARIFGT